MNEHPLRRYRLARRIKATEMAQRCNVSRQTIHRIENGTQMPSMRLMSRLGRASGGVLDALKFIHFWDTREM